MLRLARGEPQKTMALLIVAVAAAGSGLVAVLYTKLVFGNCSLRIGKYVMQYTVSPDGLNKKNAVQWTCVK